MINVAKKQVQLLPNHNRRFHNEFQLSDANNKKFSILSSNQLILERVACPEKLKLIDTFVSENSHTLPNVTWTYDANGVCQGEYSQICAPPFLEFKDTPEYYTAGPSKFLQCMSRKAMSRVSKSLSWLLNDPLNFFYSQMDLIDYSCTKNCESVRKANFYDSIEAAQTTLNATIENEWKYLLIVRDPIERFISGYTHIGRLETCEHKCFGCGANVTCFIEQLTKQVWEMHRVKMQIDVAVDHLRPQTWGCQLHKYYQNYTILHYNSDSQIFFDTQLGPFLRSRNVSDNAFEYIRNRMISMRTKHSTSQFKHKEFLEKRIRNSPYLTKLLLQLFYHDYKAFGLTLPEVPI
ncbi:hypothetical protein M3Y97_00963700 [Aphelenchoides bicaudatus]|nr:hypothetical protein M3Y97_00963700 [Aphelenchoides bicaudatus]